jgi:hypothetical protein
VIVEADGATEIEAAAPVTLNALLVAEVRPDEVAERVYVPALLIEQPVNVADPAEAFFVVPPVQVRIAPVGFDASARMIEAVLLTVLLLMSWTVTTGEVGNVAPTATVVGWVVKASLEAVPTPTVNEALVAEVRGLEVAERVYVPGLSIEQPVNVADPAEALFVSPPVQVRIAPVGFDASARMIEAVLLATVLPALSSTVTTGEVGNVAPTATVVGWVVKASRVAGPITLKATLTAGVRGLELAERVYVPGLSIEQPVNVADPAEALVVSPPVQASVAPVGFDANARSIEAALLATVLPALSSTVTTGEVGNVAPTSTVVGWVVKASCVAGPAAATAAGSAEPTSTTATNATPRRRARRNGWRWVISITPDQRALSRGRDASREVCAAVVVLSIVVGPGLLRLIDHQSTSAQDPPSAYRAVTVQR